MNPNSALRWLPVITDAGLPVPRTVIVPYSHRECVSIFDGEASVEFSRLSDAVMSAAREVGFPAFIRTDLSSAKHSGPSAYRIEQDGHNEPIARTMEDNELKFWIERYGPSAFLVREFLPLEAKFEAFSGLPVNREFRVFSAGLHDLCIHPYWPHDAVDGHVNEGKYPNWREDLSLLHQLPDDESDMIQRLAREAVLAICRAEKRIEFWSVDFAQDVNGNWWLIDMATAADSYHWPLCMNEDMVRRKA